MYKRLNPDMSDMEIEELYWKNKGKVLNVEEVPFDVPIRRNSLNSKNDETDTKEMKPSKQFSGPAESSKSSVPDVMLRKPTGSFRASSVSAKPNISQESIETMDMKLRKQIPKPVGNSRSSAPNVMLRKPNVYSDEDNGNVSASRFRMTPKHKEPQKTVFSDMTLMKKPERSSENGMNGQSSEAKPEAYDMTLSKKPELIRTVSSENENSGNTSETKYDASNGGFQDVISLKKPEPRDSNQDNDQEPETVDSIDEKSLNLAIAPGDTSENEKSGHSIDAKTEASDDIEETSPTDFICLKKPEPQKNVQEPETVESIDEKSLNFANIPGFEQITRQSFASDNLSEKRSADSLDFELIGKPERLDQLEKPIPQMEAIPMNYESNGSDIKPDNFLETSPDKEREEHDWTRAERLAMTGKRQEMELISCSTKGFVVSFGSLMGFLPYRNLATSWRFLVFQSWLKRKGLDPSMYKQSLGTIRSYEDSTRDSSKSGLVSLDDNTLEIEPDMKLEELLSIYDQEKLEFLKSFVGQRVNVLVILADRKSRRLIVSMTTMEKVGIIKKKRSLMAKLRVGDVVKGVIKKINFHGIFVQVEGVNALISQDEISWDATLDPVSYFKVGQVIYAKVHQLDFWLDRIFLSLKEITPNPLMEALEVIVGEHDNLDGNLEAAQPEAEWPEVESLIRELQQYEGISSVSKGRYFLSPGLAPTFQVYMASVLENQYKLLARSGKQVQEVIVQTSLSKEEMKSAILVCTNKVE